MSERGRVVIVMPDDFSLWSPRRGLIRRLVARGYEVLLVSAPGPYVERLEALGARHIALGPSDSNSLIADLRYVWALFLLFRRERPRIVHALATKPSVYAPLAAWLARVPRVVANIDGLGRAFGAAGVRGFLARTIVVALYATLRVTADRVRFMNRDDARYFLGRRLIRRDQAVVIVGEGAEPDEYAPGAVPAERVRELRERFIRPGVNRFVVMLARPLWSKGVREFVLAAEEVHRRDPRTRFLLVGGLHGGVDVVPEAYLRGHESDAFEWVGFWPDLREMISVADVVALPSYLREGAPNVLIEAMLMERPVVAADNVGSRDVIERGPGGVLVPPRDPKALADALFGLLQDDERRTELGRAARETALTQFDQDVLCRRVVGELYGDSPAGEEPAMDDRKLQESHFHDHLREGEFSQRYTREAEDGLVGSDWSNFKFYSIERKSRAYTDDWISRNVAGKRVLDYGCGNGEDVIFAAQHGAAEAIGIDLSPTSVSNGAQRAAELGLSDRAKFMVMDAEAMTFPDDSFDVVLVYGVLHHMAFSSSMSEIARILKPGGRAICTEALAHNPAIHWYRKATPALRTPWEVEHIMRRSNILEASRWFGRVKHQTFHLATIAAVPFRRTPLFGPILTALEAVDSVLLRVPGLKWWAWQVVFELEQPKK